MFGIIIDSIISLTWVFADFMSVVRVGTHETAWEPGCRSMRPFAWVHVEKRMRPSSIPTARHFPIAVASFMRNPLDYSIPLQWASFLSRLLVLLLVLLQLLLQRKLFHIMVSLLPASIKSSVWLTSVASNWSCISICTSSRRCSCSS